MERGWLALALLLGLGCLGCQGGGDGPALDDAFRVVVESEAAALLSVSGTAADDVWMVGADPGDGTGPLVLSWDGRRWQRHRTGTEGDLWWVQALPDGTVFMAGSDAQVLRYRDGEFERIATPGLGRHIIYGLCAFGAEDVYAVGAAAGRSGFVWHYDDGAFVELPLDRDLLPRDDDNETPGLFKVWGADGDDVWVVGHRGVVLHGNAEAGFERVDSGTETLLFTVHGDSDHVVIVGGENEGRVLAGDDRELEDVTPGTIPLLQGVSVGPDGTVWAVGLRGEMFHGPAWGRSPELEAIETGIELASGDSLHSVWVDPDGGVWAVGGNVLAPGLDRGIAIHNRAFVDKHTVERIDPHAEGCPEAQVDPFPDATIARRWNEQLLNAVRRDLPRPTVHARNLFHVSVAMWDAWAAFDEDARGYVSEEKAGEELKDDLDAAREEAISYAAYRVLAHRYGPAVGGELSVSCFDAMMDVLGLDPEAMETDGDGARALGNRIGEAVIEHFADDGANEQSDYADPDGFRPDNPLLVVDEPGIEVDDPIMWQELVLAEAVTQNGIPEGSGTRGYVGAQWREVTPFALQRPEDGGPYYETENPPLELEDLVESAVQVIRKSSELDVEDDVRIDISPGGYGNNPLGSDDGTGHPVNPVTGEPYAVQSVLRGDFTRVLAEFWADGPQSETPPGHWNTLANQIADSPDLERRLFGEGEPLDPLAWDVHVYLALNGAVHDAAIAAWELKRTFVSSRPITLIRYLGGLGQRSDPDGPAYDPGGLPLVDDLIEVITEETTAAGERHAHLAGYEGELAVRSWRGEPGDREHDIGRIKWIRVAEWIPYQRRTFVTPAFPGYVSGHSTFSRAAAEVLTQLTGSMYFPGGLGTYDIERGYLVFEGGPQEPLQLQWATYYDASDQAGQSRLWGGIHIWQDDYDGRRVGAQVGEAAIARARELY